MERTNGFLIVIRYRHCCASPSARNRGYSTYNVIELRHRFSFTEFHGGKREARICVILVHERKKNMSTKSNQCKVSFPHIFLLCYLKISELATCLEPLTTEYKVRSAKVGTR